MHRRHVLSLVGGAVLFPGAALAQSCGLPSGAEAALADVTNLTNDLRRRSGLSPLDLSPALFAAAQEQACHMAATGRMSHSGAGGSGVGDRASAAGYRWRFVAENVAAGHPDAQAVVAGWQASPGHRDNMLSRQAVDIGLGVAAGGGRLYWAMVLGAPL